MADNKKSFILYADLIHTVKKMPPEKAGELLLTILEYVNDNNPEILDPYVDIVFESIKQQLKRDLEKYEGKKKQWSDAGKRSADLKKEKKIQRTLTTVEGRSTDSTVSGSGSVSVNDSVNEIYKEKDHLRITWNEMNKLIDEFGEIKADDYVNQVLNYRKNSKYKSLYLTALKWLRREKDKSVDRFNESGKPKLSI